MGRGSKGEPAGLTTGAKPPAVHPRGVCLGRLWDEDTGNSRLPYLFKLRLAAGHRRDRPLQSEGEFFPGWFPRSTTLVLSEPLSERSLPATIDLGQCPWSAAGRRYVS